MKLFGKLLGNLGFLLEEDEDKKKGTNLNFEKLLKIFNF